MQSSLPTSMTTSTRSWRAPLLAEPASKVATRRTHSASTTTRSLDASLHTTHGPTRPFLIAARLCALAVYRDDLKQLKERRASGRASLLTSLSLWKDYFRAWWSFVYFYRGLALVEMASDIRARWKKIVQFGANRVGKEGSAEKAKSAARACMIKQRAT
ncbi:uncharacterized protein PSANT_07093 [Moesziomyces antarcticus]|uniref:Uncharacterized protein n=1 Tax=Pseudozyma antarctica TaxID=84753 RepID=A0A5C3FYR1_PSEA2|nr:uncharacterized protein PSANT_07093 [Moesziomyces antarcticus]